MTALHYMNRRVNRTRAQVVITFMVLLLVSACTSDPILAQDFYDPDSAYFMPFQLHPDPCTDEILIRIPVFLWTDGFARYYGLRLTVTGYSGCQDVKIRLLNPCTDSDTFFTCNESDTMHFGAACWSGDFITPGSGLVSEFEIRAEPGDTVSLSPMPGLFFTLSDYINWWYPRYTHLDTIMVVPDSIVILPGDADCSGLVTISDAVFVIQYIFSGGCEPYAPNSADSNGDCLITISDIVYLINYIFAAGTSPHAGCVTDMSVSN